MTTISQLADLVTAEVYGYSQTVEVSSYLTTSVTALDVEFSIADASNFSRGIVQIGDELVLIDAANRSGGKLTCGDIAGRGLRGTTVTGHPPGERVTMAPVVPRSQALSAIRDTLRASSGLFRVGTYEFTANAAQRGYALPAEAKDILGVSWQSIGPSQTWVKVRQWRYDRHNGLLVLTGAVAPGRTVRVAYTSPPTVPADGDPFTDTGLPDSCEDVIRLGAAWRVVSFLEPFTLLPNTAESDAMGRGKSPGTRISVARYLYQLYQVRLQEELAELQNRYPITTHWSLR